MIEFITAHTLANAVRMGARSRRPKAVFLASDKADIELVQALLSEGDCRIIPAHSRENAVETFEILVKDGYEGVFTAVNAGFAPADDQDVLGEHIGAPDEIVGVEGIWEDVKSQGSMLAGQHVRVTVVSNPRRLENGPRSANGNANPNTAMLHALSEIEEIRKGMNPKQSTKDHLGEARSGAMYGIGDDD